MKNDPLFDEFSTKAADDHSKRNIQPLPKKVLAPIETPEDLKLAVQKLEGSWGLKKKRR